MKMHGGVILPSNLLKSALKGECLVFVMNKNYLDEIKCMSENRYEYIALD